MYAEAYLSAVFYSSPFVKLRILYHIWCVSTNHKAIIPLNSSRLCGIYLPALSNSCFLRIFCLTVGVENNRTRPRWDPFSRKANMRIQPWSIYSLQF
jgi:hypothetical protein